MWNGPLLDPVPVWVDADRAGALVIRCGPDAQASPRCLPGASRGLDWASTPDPEVEAWINAHAVRVLPQALLVLGRDRGEAVILPEMVPKPLHGRPGVRRATRPTDERLGGRCWTCGDPNARIYNRWRYDLRRRLRWPARPEMMCRRCHRSRHIGGYPDGAALLAEINAWTPAELGQACDRAWAEWVAASKLSGTHLDAEPPPLGRRHLRSV